MASAFFPVRQLEMCLHRATQFPTQHSSARSEALLNVVVFLLSQALQVTALQQRRARRYTDAAARRLQLRCQGPDTPRRLQQAEAQHAADVAAAGSAAETLAAEAPRAVEELRLVVVEVAPLAQC